MMRTGENIEMGRTTIKRLELYKDRWTTYGVNTGILGISEMFSPQELRQFEIFRDYNDEFLEKLSPDISVVRWKKDAILFEEGTYLDLAFFIARGSVEVYLHKQQGQLGRPIFDASRPWWPKLLIWPQCVRMNRAPERQFCKPNCKSRINGTPASLFYRRWISISQPAAA